MRKSIWAAAAAIACISTAALATVTFDTESGMGFVGKGDVQIAFGWNNQKLQSNAPGVSFTYDVTSTYDVECEWDTTTGNGGTVHHDITVPRHRNISSSVLYESRKNSSGLNGPVTGWYLNGFTDDDTGGVTIPQVGDTCPGASSVALITAVTLVSSTGGLYVNFGGDSVLLQ